MNKLFIVLGILLLSACNQQDEKIYTHNEISSFIDVIVDHAINKQSEDYYWTYEDGYICEYDNGFILCNSIDELINAYMIIANE